MRAALLFTAFLLNGLISYCQTPSISDNVIVLKLTVTDFNGNAIKGKVNFENVGTHKTGSCTTDKDGKATYIVHTEENYSITIAGSTDKYEYEIPEFGISPLAVSFKFHLTKTTAVEATKP